jgi:ABC-type molybdate transport system permease subunit
VRIVLAGAEILAAVLFVIPPSEKIGGFLLLIIFGLAVVIHTLHGDFGGMEVLLVYAAAVFACLAFRTEPAHR